MATLRVAWQGRRRQIGRVSRPLLTLMLAGASALLAWQGQGWGMLAVLMMLAVAWLPASGQPERAQPTGLEHLLERLLPVWARQIATARSTLDAGAGGLLESFGRVQAANQMLKAEYGVESAELGAASDAALHELQFADRMGQQLGVIEQDVLRLLKERESLANADEQYINQWLEQLAEQYTTDEQRLRHEGAAQAPAPSQGVDFF